MRLFSLIMTGAALSAAPASAYQIGSGDAVKKGYDLHETITALARRCLAEAGGLPKNCAQHFEELPRRTSQRQAKIRNTDEYASRWPDDPTRMLDRNPSKIRFGASFLTECASAPAQGPTIDRVGLLCSSHFGSLQFMHAQAALGDAHPSQTREKVINWIMFAYRVATDKGYRDSNYCESVDALPNPSLRQALALGDRGLCASRKKKFLGILSKKYAAWKTATLFSLQCPNPLQEKVCWERVGDFGDESARLAARGAVLHAIQDSFSQSHVARVVPGERPAGPQGPFRPRIVCQSATLFYDYRQQSQPAPDDNGAVLDDPHGAADFPPQLEPSTCLAASRPVDDVITASSVALFYMDSPDSAAFEQYLRARIFPA